MPPIQIKVGSKHNIFDVHSYVFAPFLTSAIHTRTLGSWKETSNYAVDVAGFDEHTVSWALSYFYAPEYHSSLELNYDIKEGDCEDYKADYVRIGHWRSWIENVITSDFLKREEFERATSTEGRSSYPKTNPTGQTRPFKY